VLKKLTSHHQDKNAKESNTNKKKCQNQQKKLKSNQLNQAENQESLSTVAIRI
jgi:hypothetical protein